MRKNAILAASLAALAGVAATSASATTVSFSSDPTLPSYITNSKVLADFSTPEATNGATATYNGAMIMSSSMAGVGTKPAGSDGNFLAVLGNTSYTLDLPPASVVSFIEGSIDSYNKLVVSFTQQADLTLIGSALGPIEGDGRLTIDTGSITNQITKLVFSSSTNSYEIDSIVSSAPEAATWTLMILGFGVAGAALRGRRKERNVALAF